MIPGSRNINDYADFLSDFVTTYIPVDHQELARFFPYMEIRHFKKREEVLKYGQTDDYLNVVVSGLLRKFVLVGKNEKTLQLATEGKIVQSEISFHLRLPSTVIIDALEPTTVVSMRYDMVQEALQVIPSAEELGRKLMTRLLIKKDERYRKQLTFSTRERFLYYLRHHPDMLQRVPQKILASYLDIKPETFSRLKHLIKD